jgi:S-DNA-T family DNA segregation ATPase FtsK/SpoIIIE
MKNHNQNSKKKNSKESLNKEKNPLDLNLSYEIRRLVFGVLIILLAIIISLSFFDKAGTAGGLLKRALSFLFGQVMFLIPIFLALFSSIFFKTNYKKFLSPALIAVLILILGVSGIFETLNIDSKIYKGGFVGYILSWPLLKFFGVLATQIIFIVMIIISGLIFRHLIKPIYPQDLEEEKKPLISRIFKKIIATPKLKVKEVAPEQKINLVKPVELKTRPLEPTSASKSASYQLPPTNLLEADREIPNSGDTRVNSAVIKKTLQNFDIQVEMSEINIGPTVTQYTLKPAEGVKLSRITALSNDLSLALASHPIRIEAPIPGRSLVGIEVPNKARAQVRMRNLIENPNFKNSLSSLITVLGRDVSGVPVYADLSRMPHLLVAGATGTGKTIFLNTLISSLLYKNSTETLKFILIDPKRVEFTIYNNLPHLLCPVIHDPQRSINALKWLTGEMERRFEIFAQAGARDIASFNELVEKDKNLELMSFIVLIVDELADLMAARGREIEAGIVRLAQMARAVGIHLVVATQRPSVEVITGLIKANITSRITFQVASQVDSRTVIDAAGAEKLLGLGDLLYISADTAKPKRIQGPYVSEKEVKKVVNYIKSKFGDEKNEGNRTLELELSRELEKTTEAPHSGFSEGFSFGEDPLYEEARGVVVEARKASASLLQRRLRIGYARAARLIDILEERGVVGPANGAKPRDVFPEDTPEEINGNINKNQEN